MCNPTLLYDIYNKMSVEIRKGKCQKGGVVYYRTNLVKQADSFILSVIANQQQNCWTTPNSGCWLTPSGQPWLLP